VRPTYKRKAAALPTLYLFHAKLHIHGSASKTLHALCHTMMQ
jgi:hypothetical protein